MSRRALALLVLTLTLLLVALSTGTTAYYLLFLMLLFLLLGGFLSALSALFLTRAQVILPAARWCAATACRCAYRCAGAVPCPSASWS